MGSAAPDEARVRRLERKRVYVAANRERINAQVRARYHADPEPKRAANRARRRAEDPEVARAKRREYRLRDGGEALRRAQRRWKAEHPERVALHKRQEKARRRARTTGPGTDRGITWEVLWDRDHGVCGVCGLPVEPTQHDPHDPAWEFDPTVEHYVPLGKPGEPGPHRWDNVRLAHRACNERKGDRTLPRWLDPAGDWVDPWRCAFCRLDFRVEPHTRAVLYLCDVLSGEDWPVSWCVFCLPPWHPRRADPWARYGPAWGPRLADAGALCWRGGRVLPGPDDPPPRGTPGAPRPPDGPDDPLGRAVRRLRQHRGWTYRDLASRAGLSTGSASNLEWRPHKVSARARAALLDALGLRDEHEAFRAAEGLGGDPG